MLDNPVLGRKFDGMVSSGSSVTVEGVSWKAFFFMLFTFLSAFTSWHYPEIVSYIAPFTFAALGIGIFISFKPKTAAVLAPVYCVIQGVCLGSYSMLMEMQYPGIVIQSVLATFGIAISSCFLYGTGIIDVDSKFVVISGMFTLGVGFIYIVDLIVMFVFGTRLPMLHENSLFGILVSLVIIGVAISQLLVDFERIKQASKEHVEETYECYLAFGLVLTLIWLYMEVLRLLGKTRSRD